MEKEDAKILHSFVMLSGREFASGVAAWDGEHLAIGHHVHIAGKEFEDVQKELKEHLGDADVLAQATMPVSFVPVEEQDNPTDVLSKLSRASGLAQNNISVVLIDRVSGLLLCPGQSRNNCIAAGFSKMLLAKRKADLAALGVPNAKLSSRLLNAIGALRRRMKKGEIKGTVLCASMLAAATQLFIVSKDDVVDVGPIEYGYAGVLMQIMSELNLKFEGSAARLFFGNIFDFADHGDSLASPVAPGIRNRLATRECPSPAHFLISGLPPARTKMFTRHIATALGINPLNIPIEVEAIDGDLPVLPAVGAPSMVNMLVCASTPDEPHPFNFDLNSPQPELTDYWQENRAEEKVAEAFVPNHPSVIRMYRGLAFGPNGQPVENPTPSPSAGATKHPAAVKMYRGAPVYSNSIPEDQKLAADTAAPREAPSETEDSSKEVVHMYRGVAFKTIAKLSTMDRIRLRLGREPGNK